MLPRNYRLTAYNDSGSAVAITVSVRRKRYSSGSSIEYETAEAVLLDGSAVANATLLTGVAQNNDADGWLALDGVMSLTGTGTGLVTLYMEPSTDDGVSWPGARRGMPIGAGVPAEGLPIAVAV